MASSGPNTDSITSSSTTSRTRPEIEDPSSIFYLHPADGPGIILVSEKLDSKNYQTWSKAMERALTVKNKLQFIDINFIKPTEDPILANYWDRNNTIVLTWILNSLTKEINHTVQYHTQASLLWKELRIRYQQANGPRLFKLHRDLMNLPQQSLSVSTYFSKLKVLWDEICNFRPKCTCGQLDQYFENQYLMIFLMGLQDSLSHTRSQLLLMDPLPDVTKAYYLVSQEEAQREIQDILPSSDQTNTMAFATKTAPLYSSSRPNSPYPPSPYSNPSGFRPPSSSYRPPLRPNFIPNRPNRPYCTHCQMPGHTINTCFKIHGYPPGYRPPTPRFPSPLPPTVNNISTDTQSHSQNLQNFIQSMSPDQFSQLSQLMTPTTSNDSSQQPTSSTPSSHSCTVTTQTGQDLFEEDWQG